MTPLPHDPGPHWGEVGIHGLHQLREWDAVALVDDPALAGDELRAVVLADGECVVERGDGSLDAGGLVRALELAPPYRMEAVRRSGTTWAVGARSLVVAELPVSVRGIDIELVWDGRERSLRVDGAPGLGSVPFLEALAGARFDTWIVRAHRLRDTHWEVEVDPL